MTTYALTGVTVQFGPTGAATAVLGAASLSVVFPDGNSDISYVIENAGAPGELDEVDVVGNIQTVLVNGISEPTMNGGAGTDAQFGELVWNDGGTVRTSYIISLFDESTDLDHIFVVGGDALPVFASAAVLNDFFQNDLISIDGAGPGSGYAPGDLIDLSLAPGVSVTENDTIIGTDGVDILDGGIGDDTIDPGENGNYDTVLGSVGNDTINLTSQTGNDDYYELNYGNLGAGIVATLNGSTDVGTVDKGANGTDTILGVQQTFDAGYFNGGMGFFGSSHDDTFNITVDGAQWMQVRGGAGNDTFNITQLNGGVVRIDYSGAAGGINVNLDTGVVSDDGDGGMDTISGDVWEIRGSDHNDIIVGSDADESFIGREGTDTIDGGDGFDRIRYDRGGVDGAVNVDLSTGVITGTWAGNAFTHTVSNIEWVRGSVFNDTMNGSSGDDRLDGRDGADILNGGDGNDRLDGGDGDDTINPGDNNDFDVIVGSRGNDTYIFTDSLLGFQSHDYWSAGLSSGITVNINGIANTGTIAKGVDGTDTLTDISTILEAGFSSFFGGYGLYATNFADSFTITNTPGSITDPTGQWMLIRGNAGADSYNIVSGIVRLEFVGDQAVSVDLSTGTVLNDGHGFVETITGDVWELRGGNTGNTFVGSSNDEAFIGGAGNDFIDGGDGFDRVRYDRNGVESGVVVDLGGGTATGTWSGFAFSHTLLNIEWVFGSVFGDSVSGTVENERFDGKEGDDTLNGLGGDDELNGDDGDDTIEGGAGADTMDGGDNTAAGDTLSYAGSALGVTVDMDTGSASGGDAAGDTFTDFENLLGSSNADTLTGDGDDNVIEGGAGADTLNGGANTAEGDTLSYAGSSAGVTVFLDTNSVSGGDAAGDTISNFENVSGSSHVDFLYGDSGANAIDGNDAADWLFGRDGADTIEGGAGADLMFGDGGADTMNGGDDGDFMWGGADGDTMHGNDGIDWLRGEGGVDMLFGDAGDDILIGGTGDDVMTGGIGTDTFYGEADNDTINGEANGDVAFGQEGDDIINGGSEGDFLFGGDGADTINGGTENDLMWGDMPGTGDGDEDVFVFEDNWGFDAVYDFELGIDQISMGAVTGLTQFTDLTVFDGGANVTVVFDGNAITLYGVTLAELNANQADFDFS